MWAWILKIIGSMIIKSIKRKIDLKKIDKYVNQPNELDKKVKKLEKELKKVKECKRDIEALKDIVTNNESIKNKFKKLKKVRF